MRIGGQVCDVDVMIAQKHTGQGFLSNLTMKGPQGSSDANTSIFRGLSRVHAFFRNLETLPDTESQLLRNKCVVCEGIGHVCVFVFMSLSIVAG